MARRKIGLGTGLVILASVALGMAGLLLAGPERTAIPDADTPMALPPVAEVFADDPTQRLVGILSQLDPDLADTLHHAAAAEDSAVRTRKLVLQASIAAMRREAPYLRYVSVANFDRIMAGFDDGMTRLGASGSDWCDGPSIAALTRENEADLVPVVLSEISASDTAYFWTVDWSRQVLEAALQARTEPVRHGERTMRDEQVVQAYGRQLGMEKWNVALSIATFSQAEGRDYDTMRDAIAAVNVCTLGQTMATLSERLPSDVRGRVLAELAPELFYGNTPYVLYLLQGYFFIG